MTVEILAQYNFFLAAHCNCVSILYYFKLLPIVLGKSGHVSLIVFPFADIYHAYVLYLKYIPSSVWRPDGVSKLKRSCVNDHISLWVVCHP